MIFSGHILKEDHSTHPNGVFPHTSTQSMFENIPMKVGTVKNLDSKSGSSS